MSCEVCQEVLGNLTHSAKRVKSPHHGSAASFKQSVDQGCYTCCTLWEYLTVTEKNGLADHETGAALTTAEIVDHKDEHGPYGALDTWSFQSDSLETLNVPFVFFFRSLSPGPHSTNSPESLSLAAHWMKDCMTNHRCDDIRTQSQSWYPVRLLDFAPKEPYGCRLIETNDVDIREPYMTLSHCWGKRETLRLTTDNHDEMAVGIDPASMPIMYQEARQVVLEFGMRYLWIDSLCIIQQGDNGADWLRQVTQMSDVYANSYCNISALQALDSHQTMFSTNKPPDWASQIINLNGTQMLVSSDYYWMSEVSCPNQGLNTRAWVYQERLVSPRVLHFGASQVMWECREKDASQCHPEALPRQLTEYRDNGLRFKELIPTKGTSPNNDVVEGYARWEQIVQDYSGCNITFPRDRLPAISAVARQMQRALDDQYIAGLWRKNMPHGLLWKSTVHGLEETKSEYHSPSWSWASASRGVAYYHSAAAIQLEVTDVHLEHATTDEYGPLRQGWLQLKGELQRCSLLADSELSPGLLTFKFADVPLDSSLPELDALVDTDELSEEVVEMNKEEALFCMLAAQEDNSTYWLILKLMDKNGGVYRRIGLAECEGDLDLLTKGLGTCQSRYPCESYKAGLHHIRLV